MLQLDLFSTDILAAPSSSSTPRWVRVDDVRDARGRRSKCAAEHELVGTGYRIVHCGHPTALWPWLGVTPEGEYVSMRGVGPGRGFSQLEEAKEAIETLIAERARPSSPAPDPNRVTRIALVACASQKLPYSAPARELYTSALFRKSLAVAEQTCDRVFIVSAKHGLVELDTPLEPYDQSLNELRVADRAGWGSRVASALYPHLRALGRVELVFFTGELYSSPIRVSLNHYARKTEWSYAHPLAGLSIGQRLQRLNSLAKGTDK